MASVSKDLHCWTRRAAISRIKGLHAAVPPIQNATSIHGDSFRMPDEGEPRLGTYDPIVLDNNLGGVHDDGPHFDALPAVFNRIDRTVPYALLALNLSTDPDLMNIDPHFAAPTFEEQRLPRVRVYRTRRRRLSPSIAAAYAREARKAGWEVAGHALAPRAAFFPCLLLFLRPVHR